MAGGLSVWAQVAGDNNRGADLSPKDPIQARTVADEAKSFVMPAGYRMEPVLSDPDIENPSVIEFDANGRMYVVEFRTYMRDVDGNGQRDPLNRISRWEDTNGDGTYDRHTVFADRLVLPRMVLPLQDGVILTNETDSDDVIKLSDTNGDGVADKREVFFTGVGLNRDGNLEHMQSGFVWGLDNWIYSTYNAFRFRWTPGGILREPTGANGGQWGLSQDDDGQDVVRVRGCERGPLNFQVPIQYGAFRIQARPESPTAPANTFDEYERDFDIVYPLPSLADVQGGMGRVRMPIGAVNHATATNGPDIVRGHRVPEDLRGDLLYAEPVGRLIRRAKIVKDQGLTQLRNAYPNSEFILSSDPLFRPVNIRTAPDGTVYIADMYRGIIQEAEWAGPGSYLRMKIQQYQLEKIKTHGRIWRLRYDGTAEVPGTPVGPAASRPIPAVPATPAIALDFTAPRMYAATSTQLVANLGHPNGWWRDTAQRQLVLKQDKSVVPALTAMARGVRAGTDAAPQGSDTGLTPRFHALWTLEGLGALDPALVRELMQDPNPRMRVQAIRASETLFKAGNKSFEADYRQAASDTDPDVAIQAMMTLRVLRVADAQAVITSTMANNKARGVQELGRLALASAAPGAPAPAGGRGGPVLAPEMQMLMDRGQTIYTEICFSCHGEDGRGTPKATASLAKRWPAARRLRACAGPPRLRHQDHPARLDRGEQRPQLLGSHDSDEAG
jgi:putative membrane-bound dehydrogenase-like protein